ncbi:hypothetical protein [Streptomyces adustus]
MNRDQEWGEAKQRLPFGMLVQGTVLKVFPFGMFVHVSEFSSVKFVIDAVSYRPNGMVIDPAQWPAIGSSIEGVVVDHVEHNREIKLSVG